MSVTFYSPSAPHHTEPNEWFEADEPESTFNAKTVEVSDWPELNVANANAHIILRLIGMPEDELIGQIPPARLPHVAHKLLKVLNNTKTRQSEVRPDYAEGNMFDCGCSEDQILHYATSLIELCKLCYLHGSPICFA